MSRLTDWIDDGSLDDPENSLHIRNAPGPKQRSGKKSLPKRPLKPAAGVAALTDQKEEFNFSYQATRHERTWIINSLEGFYDGQWLDDVVRLIKGGKEAHVYQCAANASVPGLVLDGEDHAYLAAKIYRPRKFRNLKNDHMYREGRENLDEDGRTVNDDGMLHAIAKRTEYGRELMHTSWIEHEYNTMRLLHRAGADVPRPFTSGSNAILMAYLGDEESPAPTLNSVRLERHEAPRLFERTIHNIDLMLANNRIHADLSAYNILYWEGEITLIDFPQAVDPLQNRNAFLIFQRDVVRVCEYFSRQGVKTDGYRLASDLWRAHRYPRIPDVHPRLLDPESDQDRRLWRDWSADR